MDLAVTDPLEGRKKPGPPKGLKKPMLVRHLRHARQVWREGGHRSRLAKSIEALGGLTSLPLLIGGVQRGVVRSWIEDGAQKPAMPRPPKLHRVLAALADMARARGLDPAALEVDEELYWSYFRAWPREKLLSQVCLGLPETPGGCPRKRGVTLVPETQIMAAERRRGRKFRFSRLPNGQVIRLCGYCARRKALKSALVKLEKLERAGAKRRPRGPTRRRTPKSSSHREAIRRGHVAAARLSRPFRLCLLCDLIRYASEWHQPCWLTWKFYCEGRGLDPHTERPERYRRRGPHPEDSLKECYDVLIARRLQKRSRSEIIARRPDLAVPSNVNAKIDAFLKHAAGSWGLMVKKGAGGNSERERALSLSDPAPQDPIVRRWKASIEAGARDHIIRRVYGCGMQPDKIADLTGASLEHVREVVGIEPRPHLGLPWWHFSRTRNRRVALGVDAGVSGNGSALAGDGQVQTASPS